MKKLPTYKADTKEDFIKLFKLDDIIDDIYINIKEAIHKKRKEFIAFKIKQKSNTLNVGFKKTEYKSIIEYIHKNYKQKEKFEQLNEIEEILQTLK